nr:inorganic diphosphatase [uncultured Psychroserpens sp.]
MIYCLCLLFVSCKTTTDYYGVSTFSKNNKVNAVVEIPAGTNKKFEYNNKTKTFNIDKKNGKDRVINFLPYLGNYGFIPSTFSDPKEGGDGDALDILVLAEYLETGTVIESTPIAMLKLIDDGEIDYKIIAIPSDKEHQIINCKSYVEFNRDYPEIKSIIEIWFLNYNKDDETQIEGWATEKEAIAEINKNLK